MRRAWLALAALAWASIAAAAPPAVAIYTGTFDPPTLGHRAAIDGALAALGPGGKLVIRVNAVGAKTYKAGARERGAMMRAMVHDLGDRVLVLDDYQDEVDETLRRAEEWGAVPREELRQVIGEDSFGKVHEEKGKIFYGKPIVIRRPDQAIDAELLKHVDVIDPAFPASISSTGVREAIGRGRIPLDQLAAAVAVIIRDRGLYRVPSPLEARLREEEFHSAFRARALEAARTLGDPSLILAPPPAFEPLASRNAWSDAFFKALTASAGIRPGTEERRKLIGLFEAFSRSSWPPPGGCLWRYARHPDPGP